MILCELQAKVQLEQSLLCLFALVFVVVLANLSTTESFILSSHLGFVSLRNSRINSKLFTFKSNLQSRTGQTCLHMTTPPKSSEKVTRVPPTQDLVAEALQKAEKLIQDAGGCIDSISFGAAWKEKYPEFTRERFQGTQVSSFNKLFKVIERHTVRYGVLDKV